MRITSVDPRHSTWEDDDPVFEVHFFTKPTAPYEAAAADEYEIEGSDVVEVLDWANRKAAESDRTFLIYLVGTDHGKRGVTRLIGTDPNRPEPTPENTMIAQAGN